MILLTLLWIGASSVSTPLFEWMFKDYDAEEALGGAANHHKVKNTNPAGTGNYDLDFTASTDDTT